MVKALIFAAFCIIAVLISVRVENDNEKFYEKHEKANENSNNTER